MRVSILKGVSAIDARQWNALVANNAPFLRHEFLVALENSGCVGESTAWQPCVFACFDHANGDSQSASSLLGAIPAYLKYDSYGEYIFDWAWAHAYQRAGIDYYPKLLVAVPFTPVTGPRILVAAGNDSESISDALIQATLTFARKQSLSSVHYLFTTDQQTDQLSQLGMLRRRSCQFHWHNDHFQDFDHYLQTFSSKKRKNVRQERRKVSQQGIHFEWLTSNDLQPHHWQTFYQFYTSTIECRGAIPYLSCDFFQSLGETFGENTLLLFAKRQQRIIAGAFFLRGDDALFGRYWGADGWYDGLHFETCYYQAIEYCIAHGLARFEAGAQGEHKLSRGLLPVTTHSAHWLAHPQFSQAVSHYLDEERDGIDHYQRVLQQHSPFKKVVIG